MKTKIKTKYKKCGCGEIIPSYKHCCTECYYEFHESKMDLALSNLTDEQREDMENKEDEDNG